MAGKRRTTVREFSKLLDTPVRTLEARLAGQLLPSPRILLAWSVSLHAIWGLEMLARPLKQVASNAGFHSSEALSQLMHRHLGARPHRMAANFGFFHALGAFIRLVTPP